MPFLRPTGHLQRPLCRVFLTTFVNRFWYPSVRVAFLLGFPLSSLHGIRRQVTPNVQFSLGWRQIAPRPLCVCRCLLLPRRRHCSSSSRVSGPLFRCRWHFSPLAVGFSRMSEWLCVVCFAPYEKPAVTPTAERPMAHHR